MQYNSDFKYDLALGQLTENELGQILSDKTIEVKDDSKHSSRTGNVFIEYESRNKPSGIAKTKADYWSIKMAEDCFVLIKTSKLKHMCRNHIGTDRDVLGGDNNTSRGILLPTIELIK